MILYICHFYVCLKKYQFKTRLNTFLEASLKHYRGAASGGLTDKSVPVPQCSRYVTNVAYVSSTYELRILYFVGMFYYSYDLGLPAQLCNNHFTGPEYITHLIIYEVIDKLVLSQNIAHSKHLDLLSPCKLLSSTGHC